ncbi:MAG: hypothetical protein NC177_01540 [Ruminococcus flavefaciens]|nr:hypothetical protein [Ruminococcus flavefaciens]
MINIRRKTFTAFSEDNRSLVVAEIYIDNASELPEPKALNGLELMQSSIAYVISSGEIYVLGEDGNWYASE